MRVKVAPRRKLEPVRARFKKEKKEFLSEVYFNLIIPTLNIYDHICYAKA